MTSCLLFVWELGMRPKISFQLNRTEAIEMNSGFEMKLSLKR
jgi:hypothetical protein